MSRFIITLLAIIATTSARPHIVSYAPGYYGGLVAPSYSYPFYSYPFTPVTYVETIPALISAPSAPVAAIPIVPAKLTAKNAPPSPKPVKLKQALPALPAPAQAPAQAPARPGAPAKLITITKTLPELPDLQGLLGQVLELPPVKLLAELKTNKLQAVAGLQSALQEKLAPIAALLP